MDMQIRLFLYLMLLICPSFLSASPEAHSSPKEPSRVMIGDARTRVFLFSVYLTVGEVVEQDKQLHGGYRIRVPSSSSDNEEGKVILELENSLQEIMTTGGTVKGKGISTNSKHPERIIVCEFTPDTSKENNGKVRMTVDTGERVLRFNSTYEVFLGK